MHYRSMTILLTFFFLMGYFSLCPRYSLTFYLAEDQAETVRLGMPPVFKSTFLCQARLTQQSVDTKCSEHFNNNIPFSRLLFDSGSDETFLVYR